MQTDGIFCHFTILLDIVWYITMANLNKMIQTLKRKCENDKFLNIEDPDKMADKLYEFMKTRKLNLSLKY